MKCICSRCKIVMGFIGGVDTDDQETHGICPRCWRIEKTEIGSFGERVRLRIKNILKKD